VKFITAVRSEVRTDFRQVRIRLGLLLFWLMTISGESEQIATDYQRAGIIQTIWSCATFSRHLVYGVGRCAHRDYRAERFREIDATGDVERAGAAG
jgi:hypothetical protein